MPHPFLGALPVHPYDLPAAKQPSIGQMNRKVATRTDCSSSQRRFRNVLTRTNRSNPRASNHIVRHSIAQIVGTEAPTRRVHQQRALRKWLRLIPNSRRRYPSLAQHRRTDGSPLLVGSYSRITHPRTLLVKSKSRSIRSTSSESERQQGGHYATQLGHITPSSRAYESTSPRCEGHRSRLLAGRASPTYRPRANEAKCRE